MRKNSVLILCQIFRLSHSLPKANQEFPLSLLDSVNTEGKTTLQQNLSLFPHRNEDLEEYHVGYFMSQKQPSDYKGTREREFSCFHANLLSLSTCHDDGGSVAEQLLLIGWKCTHFKNSRKLFLASEYLLQGLVPCLKFNYQNLMYWGQIFSYLRNL